MACNKPKEMTFRIFEYDLPKTIGKGGTIHESNEDAAYHDSGKEFTISEEEGRAALSALGYSEQQIQGEDLFSATTIPHVMMGKLFGFPAWPMYWTDKYEGYIGSPSYKVWHLKRVV